MNVSPYALLIGLAAGASLGAAPAAAGESVLHNFTGGARDGAYPLSQLIPDGSGTLYGTTAGGGPNSCFFSSFVSSVIENYSRPCGTVFALTPPTKANPLWSETVIHDLSQDDGAAFPVGRLTLDETTGALYGAASGGQPFPDGCYNENTDLGPCGAIFQLMPPTAQNPQWTETTIYSFFDVGPPNPHLVMDKVGNLYGSAGNLYSGTNLLIFELSPPVAPSTTWTYSTLFTFSDATGGEPPNDININTEGQLFGTTSGGGTYGKGVVFMLQPPARGGTTWTETVLYNFTGGADGGSPAAGVGITSDGSLWGTTLAGGAVNDKNCIRPNFQYNLGCGVVFRLTPAATAPWPETVLYSFRGGLDGAYPHVGVRFNKRETALYGATYGGGNRSGAEGLGTVYELTPPASGRTWTETILHRFAGQPNDGAYPNAVYLDDDGNVFGTTQQGAKDNVGIAFEIPR